MTEPELLLAHRDFVRAVAAEIVGDVASLDDVEQETLLAAWQRGGGMTRSWRGFLATVARNFARQFRRGEKRRRRREEVAATRERTPSVAEVVAREEQRRAVVAAVLALEEPERGAVLLRFYEGVPPREIARRLAIPVETARTRVKRGVERVRARLLAREEGQARRLLAWLMPLAAPIATTVPAVSTAKLAAAGIVVAALAWSGLRPGGWLRAPRGEDGDAATTAAASAAGRDASERDRAGENADATRAIDPEAASRSADPEASFPTRRIGGRVVDARGAAIAGARVHAWSDFVDAAIALDGPPRRDRPRTTSGADGRFELAVPAEFDRCTLFATAPGLSPGTVISANPGSDVTIVLEDDDVLVGTVADADGGAIAGARVHGWGMHGGALIDVDATSGPDGSYRLPYPVADRAAWQGDGESWNWWVEFKAEGFAPHIVVQHRDLDPDRTAGETRCDVFLLNGASISGSVVDATTHKPLADARVVLVASEENVEILRKAGGNLPNPHGNRVVSEARTDEEGHVSFDHAPVNTADEIEPKDAPYSQSWPQGIELFVFAAGHAPAFEAVAVPKDGESSEFRLELWPSATIVGRVVDRDGRPLAHVRVSASEELSEDGRRHGRKTRSRAQVPPCVGSGLAERVVADSQGHYEIDGLPAFSDREAVYRVAIDDWDWVLPRGDGLKTPGARVAVHSGATVAAPDLVAVPQRSIVIDVVDESGAPIAGARVCREPRSFDERRSGADGRLRWIEPRFHIMQVDGSALPSPDAIRLRVAARGFATLVTEPLAPSDEEAPSVRIVLAHAHVVRGSVVDPLQRPAVRAGVTAWRREPTAEERSSASARMRDPTLHLSDTATDGNGNFVLDDLPDGTIFLEVHPPVGWKGRRAGAAATFADVRVDGAPLTLRLADE